MKKKIFGRQLTCINGISSQRAMAIVEKYPSPFHLIVAFNKSKDPQNLLTSIQYNGKFISSQSSKLIYDIFCTWGKKFK